MFTFMNTARIGTALQGVCATELSYQGALAYSKERRSMRALSGKKEPTRWPTPSTTTPTCAACCSP
jgi:alkylation response protein AidB-like acyl-CoA dehydrogenase